LTDEGYEVVTACDGMSALEIMRTGPAIDVVILDVRMPLLNGWEFRAEQKADSRIADVPVVVLTGDASPQARAIDATAFLSKPVVPNQLVAAVKRVLSVREMARRERAREEAGPIASLGRVLGCLGDELRPALSSALSNVELARQQLESMEQGDADEAQDAISRALAEAAVEMRRMRCLVGNLRFGPHHGSAPKGWVDLNAVVDAARQTMASDIERRAVFLCRHVPLPPVEGDAESLFQAIVNLLQNAIDAIPLASSEEHQITFVTGYEGDRVMVEVADTGLGIPSDVLPEVFELRPPRGDARRPALGLPTAKQIVAEHQGTLTLDSRIGRGTWARITLPRARGWADPARPGLVTGIQPFRGRVLLVDETPEAARRMWHVLEPAHDLIEVARLDEALGLLAEGLRFDVVFCDLGAIAQAVLSLKEDVTARAPEQWERLVILARDPTTPQAASYGAFLRRPVLAKPLDGAGVLAVVERLLEKRRRTLS
jgi:signal transduction histidine kinase